jgi:PAS domain S-box-containing protein
MLKNTDKKRNQSALKIKSEVQQKQTNEQRVFQEKEKEKEKLIDELFFINKENDKWAEELAFANKELASQNQEKDKWAEELALANKELAFQNEEKDKRAEELALANKELAFQNEEKDKRADELALANEEKEKRAGELVLANKELAFQNEEKEKRADELALANKELAFQNEEKEKRADELALANKELAFQNEEKEKRADELALANKELAFQNEEKDKRADELALANKELAFQNKEKLKRADELALANKELATQNKLDGYRKEMERVAQDLTLLIDTANAPIFGIDADGNVNEWNQKSAEITGFQPDEVMGRNLVKEFISLDYRKSVNNVLQKALKGSETSNFEFPLYTKDNDLVMVLLNATTRRNAKGDVVGVVGVGQDITELDSYRSEMERVAQDLTLLIDTANAPIFGIDADGNVNEWNQKSAQITGFHADEVLGKNLVEEFITSDYRKSVNEVLQKALQGNETSNFEFPLYTKDNDLVMVLLNATTRRNAKGDVVGVVGVGQDITELDGYRSEMERVAQDLTLLIDTANAPIFGIDAEGNVNEWNQKSAEITGFHSDEVLGRNLVEEFISLDYRKSVNNVLQKALKGNETSNYEFPLYTKDNNLVMVLLNATTRRNAKGDVVGVVGVGQDITELDSSRSEMERIAKDLIQFIDTANAPIFGIDADGNVNEWNQKSAQITGFHADEVLGKNLVEEFITADYRKFVNEVLHKALQGNETSNFEFPLYTKDNDLVMVLLNATTRRNAKGDVVGVVGVGQDITELDSYRSEMERVAQDLTLLIDTANAPIFGIDAEGNVNEWNQKSAEITGFQPDEVMGRNLVEEFISLDYRKSVNNVLQKALKGDETSNYEFPLYTKDNKLVMVLLNATTRRNTKGNVVGVIGVGQDITDRKFAEAQVIQASKLATLGEMATSVAHELNQPLHVIRLSSGNVIRRLKNKPETIEPDYLTQKLERIMQQTERAAAIIDHMTMFGRKASEEAYSVDPYVTIQSALSLVREQLRLAEINVVVNAPNSCSPVLGHQVQLEQVLLNLLTNAQDAIKSFESCDQKVIKVDIVNLENTIEISVENIGPKIPEAIIERIFEPFYTTKEIGKGTGLGLSVSYGIIRDMKGEISVKNTDSGVCFFITLPIYYPINEF